jgi:flagellar hook-associated protein 2
MISSVYNYYLSQYGHKINSKYDSHTKNQLNKTYGKVLKVNSQTPTYKVDISQAAQKYAIDLKENARELNNITNDLSDTNNGNITFRKQAESNHPEIIDASYVDNEDAQEPSEFQVTVSQLATKQTNTGNYLPPTSKQLDPGGYCFDLSINDLTYEFEFNVENQESNNDIQNKISRLINRSNIGLNANVSTNQLGNSAIIIQSDATGITGLSPVIFNIKAAQDGHTDAEKNNQLINTLGLDRTTQYPSNAVFSINGAERNSPTNNITINKAFSLSFKDTTKDGPVTISLKTDTDSIVESIDDLISGYNNLINVAASDENNQFEGNIKLRKEFAAIAHTYHDTLSSNGLEVSDNGSISVNKEAITEAVQNGTLEHVFNNLNSFKKAIQKKAEDIAINPMNYVNNKIVAYKNPTRPVIDPYNISAYSGMMFNGYI